MFRIIPRMRIPVLLLLAVLLSAVDLDRLAAGSSPVLDGAGILDAGALARCQAACRSARGDLRVLIVPDCGGAQPREAGLRLFNRWGIGDRQRNDGVLLMVALAERRCEFLLGTGLDDDAQVLRSQAIVDRELVPRFRAGDKAGGVVAAVEAAARELFPGATPTSPAAQIAAIDVERTASVAAPAPLTQPQPSYAAPTPMQDYRRSGDSVVGPLASLTGGLAALAGMVGGWMWWRRRPRQCPRCRVAMLKLDEAADNAHLTTSQQREEQVGSVDYAVWACPACPQVDIVRHGAWFTRYHSCPACGARTASDRSTLVTPASESFTGLERIDTRCVNCGHHETRNRVLPRKQAANHGSSGIRMGGSSRGGSFGGGSSGGGRSAGRGGGGGW
jgi:uncharacterized protein